MYIFYIIKFQTFVYLIVRRYPSSTNRHQTCTYTCSLFFIVNSSTISYQKISLYCQYKLFYLGKWLICFYFNMKLGTKVKTTDRSVYSGWYMCSIVLYCISILVIMSSFNCDFYFYFHFLIFYMLRI